MKSDRETRPLPRPDLHGQDSPQAIAEIWARRAATLARVPPEPDTAGQVEFLLVRLACELYGLEARHAYDIRPAPEIARVPRVPPWVAGVTNLRGRILSVLDLARFFGLSPDAEEQNVEGTGFLVAVQTPQMELALLVDQVLAVEEISLGHIKEATDNVNRLPAEYVRGIADGSVISPGSGPAGDDNMIVILDLPALLADERLIVDDEIL
ncbi:MAG: chemotaxis protein CheW [Anaerolineae bacterium]|jgi:purine-binding chemotaxis protein CheW